VRLLALVAVAACGPATPPPVLAQPGAPRLPPPAPIDPARPGAAYLSSVALQLQPGWGQFLDDCRLRLPARHPLNAMALAATEDLVIDRAGRVVDVRLAHSSGNAEFDRAVHDAIADIHAFGPPPLELVSDDDRAHLRWLFARDRRQAGPATAEVVRVELPIAGVTAHLIADGDLARAARRVALAPPSADQAAATRRVMVAALAEALHGGDTAVRLAAVAAIAAAHVTELAGDVRALLADTTGPELLLGAIAAAVALGDRESTAVLTAAVRFDFGGHGDSAPVIGELHPRPFVTLALLRALVTLGAPFEVQVPVMHALAASKTPPHPILIEANAIAPLASDAMLAGWFARGDARTRAAVCVGLAGLAARPGTAPDRAEALLQRGLADRDAMVRARCTESAAVLSRDAQTHAQTKYAARFVAAIRELERDRDREVRAAAIAAAAVIDPAHLVDASADSAAEVRVAYIQALVLAGAPDAAKLRALADDRDVDVRATAWGALAAVAPPDRAMVARGAADPASQVRAAAVAILDDETTLDHLAASDDAPEVRTAALVRLAHLRGRDRSTPQLLERLASAAPHSADRARVALAWLLAP
jgi:TonB family protein